MIIFLGSQISPLVSVILPVYNQEKYLQETIESILAQSFQNFELIILDDGSTDKSAQIIRKFTAIDGRIQSYFEANSGKSLATNYLVKKARGEWCAFLDADDVMLSHRLERQVAFHQENPKVNASSSNCYYIDEKGNMFGTQRYTGLTTVAEYEKSITKNEFIICSFTGLMVSRKVFIVTGGLLKKFEPCEDFEFFNRLEEKGYTLLIIPEILMKYRIHASSVTFREPVLVFDKISFIKHCIHLRKSGKLEISFEEFKIIQQKESWWTKFNRQRFNNSRTFFRSAGFAILSKKHLSFVWYITVSSVLSPHYVVTKMMNWIRR